jgi:hypothetical protein
MNRGEIRFTQMSRLLEQQVFDQTQSIGDLCLVTPLLRTISDNPASDEKGVLCSMSCMTTAA